MTASLGQGQQPLYVLVRGLLLAILCGSAGWFGIPPAVAEAPKGTQPFAMPRIAQPPHIATEDNSYLVSDPLYFELGRQALLMTAREEFALATRDDTLYETVDRHSPQNFEAYLEVIVPRGADLHISRNGQTLWERHLTDKNGPVETYLALCEALEPLIRGEFVEMLRQQGYEPVPPVVIDSAPLTEEQERWLLTMNHIAQWQALRSIHATMRDSGESPERLAGLVRGYANLAQLTFPLLDQRSYAYRARALLYAQRLMYRSEGSLFAQWHQQYGWVLSGLINPSNQLFKKRKKHAATSELEPPAWLELLRLYGLYQFDELKGAGEEEQSPTRQLAQLLWFQAVIQEDSARLTLEAGKPFLNQENFQLWILDELNLAGGVGFGHYITAMAPRAHGLQIQRSLPQVTELPAEPRRLLEGGTPASGLEMIAKLIGQTEVPRPDLLQRAQIAQALIEAGEEDRQEPSWQVLGRTIEGWNVLHVLRRGNFVKNSLGMDAGEEMQQLLPAIEHHPLGPLVQTLALPRTATVEEFNTILKNLAFLDGNTRTIYPFIRALPPDAQLANMSVAEMWKRNFRISCDVEGITSWQLRNYYGDNPQSKLRWAWKIGQISWHSPLRVATKLQYDWEKSKKGLAKTEKQFGRHPAVQYALGRGYEADGDIDRAIEYYERYLAAAPSADTFRRLANLYFQRRDDEKWLATMKRTFDHEDYALEHSYAASAVAATLMHQGKFEKALPWAERGADSGAAGPMGIHCECLTALERYDEAEEIAIYLTHRYGMSFGHDDWFEWCARTGRGRLEEAWELAYQRRSDHGDLTGRAHLVNEIVHLLVTNDLEAACELLTERLAKKWSGWDCLTLALLHDELGEEKLRDPLLTKLVDHVYGPEEPLGFRNLGRYFQQVLAGEEFTREKVDAILATVDQRYVEDWTGAIYYFSGVFAANRGDDDTAYDYWEPVARLNDSSWQRILAWKRLRDLDVNPAQLGKRMFDGQFCRPDLPEESTEEEPADE